MQMLQNVSIFGKSHVQFIPCHLLVTWILQNILCKELTLPPSDLAHSAERVCVLPSSGDNQSASCIAVSPEGVIRYWSNIAYESSYVEISAELKGEECDSVVNLQVLYYLFT